MQQTKSAKGATKKRVVNGGSIYEPAAVSMYPCFRITALFVVVGLIMWTIYSNIMWTMMRNKQQYYRWCIDANEHRVLPRRNASVLLEPPPLSYGLFAVDYGQSEVRWKLYDVLGDAVVLGDIALRGPLRHSSPYTAPVAIGLGISKDVNGHTFEGVLDITPKLATDIIERPYAYYVAFEDGDGYEVARDPLTDQCTTNL